MTSETQPPGPPAQAKEPPYDPVRVEAKWYTIWEKAGYFRAQDTSDKPPFAIAIPPPNVTGSLHIGHALTVAIEDLLIRWKRMSGFNTLWMPGTDHAGIATQLVVERALKAEEKKSRHDLGRTEFLQRVWAWKAQYGSRITTQLRTLGCSLDWERERFTMDEGLSRSVREVFVQLHEQGRIYRAKKLINWCPNCRTALSDLEVEHEERQGTLWHIAYPVEGSDQKLVVATTRPETMLGDTAVAVHPDDERYGALHGRRVALPLTGRTIPIITDAILVDMAFGSGAVKVTPAHDFNDYETGLRHKLEMISVLDEAGKVNAAGGSFAGLDRFEARKRVLEQLKEQGFLVKEEPHRLSVGTCQRCQTVVEPQLSFQWFVAIKPLADRAVEAVRKGETVFVPEAWTQTFYSWMENIHDWCVSRQLWWGHQIPAWYCADGHVTVARTAPATCSTCGKGELRQDDDVLDTWFSSGLWPFSTLGWPEQTAALQTFYPNSVMETGHDIIFFWVARMMMFGLHFMGKVPFKTVYLHAMVRDEQGDKMSKVKGNVVDPLDVINGAPLTQLPKALAKQYADTKEYPNGMPAYGADALRFTLISMTAQGRDIKLALKRVEGYRAFANKVWMASRFALRNLEGYEPGGKPLASRPLSLADRWILARLERVTQGTVAALEAYKFNEAASALYQFIWHEFCDWYIELSKASLGGADAERRSAAQAVLVHVLDQALKLLHPIMPFLTEEIWQQLPKPANAPASIMIAAFPSPLGTFRDDAAEAELEPVMAAIEGVRNIRGEVGIPYSKKVGVVIHADPARLAPLDKHRSYLVGLAGVNPEQITLARPGSKPSKCAAFIGPYLSIYVPLEGLIDFEVEAKRLGKALEGVEKDLVKVTATLASRNDRMPADVVAKNEARKVELEERKSRLQANPAYLHRGAGPGPPEAIMASKDNPDAGAPAAKVQIAPTSQDQIETVDLTADLADEVAQVNVPEEGVATEVRESLAKLREGTKEGLSAQDHKDLGVAYMQMGLVDDAVREFQTSEGLTPPVKAKKPASKTKAAAKKKPVKAKAGPKKAPAKKVAPKRKAKPAAKKAGSKKVQAKKKTAARKPAAKGKKR